MQDYYWAGVRDYFHFRPDLIRMAAKVVRRVLDMAGGPYNSLHYRSTDWCWTELVPSLLAHLRSSVGLMSRLLTGRTELTNGASCRAQQYPGLFITPETLTPKAVQVLGARLASPLGC